MEYIWNEETGKAIVTIGGVRWNNCTADADCPGYGLCSKDKAWQEDPATCICPLNRLVDGVHCNESKHHLNNIEA